MDEQRTLSAVCNAQTVTVLRRYGLCCGHPSHTKKNTPFSMSCKHREAVYELMTSEQAPSLWQWAMILRKRKPKIKLLTQDSFLLIF